MILTRDVRRILTLFASVAKSEPIAKRVSRFKMVSEEKNIKVIEFTGHDFKIWRQKFLVCANRKGRKELLEGMLNIPTKAEFDAAEGEKDGSEKKTCTNYKFNKLAYEDILTMNLLFVVFREKKHI